MALQRGAVFKTVERTTVPYATFDLSNENKLTCKMGYLVPFLCEELVPGDRWRWNSNFFVRLAPLVNPIMHRMDVRGAFFFVPYRILWNHWEKFRAEGNGDVLASKRADYTAPEHPYIQITNLEPGQGNLATWLSPGGLFDYLGFPSRQIVKARLTNFTGMATVKSLRLKGRFPFSLAAYYCIYDNYYRNQLLEQSFGDYVGTHVLGSESTPEGFYLHDGDNTMTYQYLCGAMTPGIPDAPDTKTGRGLVRANLEHDYFTAATPSPQLGDPVQIPIGTSAPLTATVDKWTTVYDVPGPFPNAVYPYDEVQAHQLQLLGYNTTDQTRRMFANVYEVDPDGISGVLNTTSQDWTTASTEQVRGIVEGTADLSAASGITIQDFRTLQALQRYREKLLAYGTRYNEWLLGTYAVHDGDARLDRPEFIGSFSQPVQISEVLQTSSTDSEPSPLGDYAGRGVSVGQTRDFNYLAPEDGVLMGIFQITPRTGYMCGLPHCFLRESPYDYHNPFFEHVGEQEVYDRELWFGDSTVQGTQETLGKGSVFGYNPRFSEYKYRFDEVHGDFVDDSFLSWHLARDFASQPTMSGDFFHASNIERIFAVTDESYDKFFVQIFNKVVANRPMTLYSTPM